MADAPVTPESPATPVATTAGKPRWTWFAALGLLMAGIAPLLMYVAGLLWGLSVSEEAGFFLVTGAVGLIGAFLVLRFGTWSKFVGILFALLIGMMLFWTAFGLFSPTSFFDFVPGILVVPGVLIAIVSLIGAIVAGRRGHVTPTATGGEQRGIRIALVAVIALTAVSGVLTFTSRSSVAESGDAEVVLTDFEFDEESYTFQAGSSVLIRNDDPFLHTFTIEELDIDESLSPGSEVLVEIPAQAGTYMLFCRPHTMDPDEPTKDDMTSEVTIE